MDKTSMTLGWLVGRQIAGQRRTQEKQPIAYLYNGVRLPDLPEWDREMYPYASISTNGYSYYIRLLPSDAYYTRQGTSYVLRSDSTVLTSNLRDGMWGEWEETKSGGWITSGPINSYGAGVIWTDFDLLDSSGGIFMSSSDPIPVYE